MQYKKFRYRSLPAILLAFLLLGLVLFAERSGIQLRDGAAGTAWIQGRAVTAEESLSETPATCLVIRDSTREDSRAAWSQLEQIFLDMKVGWDSADISRESVPPYSRYETVVVLISDLSSLQEDILELCHWVKDGGRAMFALTIERSNYSDLIEHKLGIISSEYAWTVVDSVHPSAEFMLGGGIDYPIMDAVECAWVVNLDEKATVHAWTGDDRKLPWSGKMPMARGSLLSTTLASTKKPLAGSLRQPTACWKTFRPIPSSMHPCIFWMTSWRRCLPASSPTSSGTIRWICGPSIKMSGGRICCSCRQSTA